MVLIVKKSGKYLKQQNADFFWKSKTYYFTVFITTGPQFKNVLLYQRSLLPPNDFSKSSEHFDTHIHC